MSQPNFIINSRRVLTNSLEDVHFSPQNKKAIHQFLSEFTHIEKLKALDLPVDNKLLFYGHTGCGKTMTAKAIANKLGKEIIILSLSGLVSSKLGETANNIKSLFDKAARERSVLFIDEFDSIGKMRDYDHKDSGEMKRLVNTIIQQIDYLPEDTVLIAATNYKAIIDTALLRRFQLQLQFELPTKEELDNYYNTLLEKYPEEYRTIDRVYNISYAEAKDKALKAVKRQVIKAETLKLSIAE